MVGWRVLWFPYFTISLLVFCERRMFEAFIKRCVIGVEPYLVVERLQYKCLGSIAGDLGQGEAGSSRVGEIRWKLKRNC